MTSIMTIARPDQCEDRREDDWYPTPWEATEALMLAEEPWLSAFDEVDEPACGDGAMADVIRGHGKRVHATDLVYRGYGTGGINFLTPNQEAKSRAMITNPPFVEAESFIWVAHARGYEYIAMLLKVNYWNVACRLPLFRECQPVRIRPISWRLNFTGGKGNHFDCNWVIWMPGCPQTTQYCAPLEKPACLSQPSLF